MKYWYLGKTDTIYWYSYRKETHSKLGLLLVRQTRHTGTLTGKRDNILGLLLVTQV